MNIFSRQLEASFQNPNFLNFANGRNSVSDLANSNDVATNGVKVELTTKPGANVNAVPQGKLA